MLSRLRKSFRELSFFQIIRGCLFFLSVLTALIAFLLIDSNVVKAPFFTLLGGFMFLVVVLPDDIKRVSAVCASVATIVVALGGWFWLETTRTDEQHFLAVGLLATAVVVFAFMYHLVLLFTVFRTHNEPNQR